MGSRHKRLEPLSMEELSDLLDNNPSRQGLEKILKFELGTGGASVHAPWGQSVVTHWSRSGYAHRGQNSYARCVHIACVPRGLFRRHHRSQSRCTPRGWIGGGRRGHGANAPWGRKGNSHRD